MMGSPSLEGENIIKDLRNIFGPNKLKKETNNSEGIRNIFRLEKDNKEIKDGIIRDIRNPFRLEKENKAIEYKILKALKMFISMKKEKKIIINQ